LGHLHHQAPRLEAVVDPAKSPADLAARVAHEGQFELAGVAQVARASAVRGGVIAAHAHLSARSGANCISPCRASTTRARAARVQPRAGPGAARARVKAPV